MYCGFHEHPCKLCLFFWHCGPTRAMVSSFMRFFRPNTTAHHSRHDSSGRVISSSKRPLPDNTQHSQETDIHAPGRIRTHNLSRQAAADLRLGSRGYWDRLQIMYKLHKLHSNLDGLVYHLLFLHVRPKKQSKIKSVALCHRKDGSPLSNTKL
jgi:hypothetical protein